MTMRASHLAVAVVVVVGLPACEGTRPMIARGLGGLDQRPATCVVRIDDAEAPVVVTNESRLLCVAKARLIEDTVPEISDDAMRAGPAGDGAFATSDDVYCRLIPRPKWGGSLKFRCMRTNAANVLYDDEGTLWPGAAGFDEDGNLLDSIGSALRRSNGTPRQGDELRIKYFLGPEPEPRQREMFTETVVSRLFWALGIPVDRVYMPASVRCFGCSADPFGQTVADSSRAARVFRLASIERPYAGKKIAVTRRRPPLGMGAEYDHGFGFDELSTVPSEVPTRWIEAEVLALALNLVGYNNTHSYQNDLLCRRGHWDRTSGACTEVVAYVADVGGTLGGARAFKVAGEPDPEMGLHPRGDFVTFAQGRVFSDPATCTLYYPIGPILQVTEAARSTMAERFRSRLDRERLRIVFEAARIHLMEQRLRDLVAAQYALAPGPTLDRAVQILWADELGRRMNEIETAQCGNVPRSVAGATVRRAANPSGAPAGELVSGAHVAVRCSRSLCGGIPH
ncbi:MAG TPA: hypothetical protein VLE53_02515 [Gemmatimonadaceae bacterium]|nr:hypothetical protein [Gemmatimonadaceae bacterium]